MTPLPDLGGEPLVERLARHVQLPVNKQNVIHIQSVLCKFLPLYLARRVPRVALDGPHGEEGADEAERGDAQDGHGDCGAKAAGGGHDTTEKVT